MIFLICLAIYTVIGLSLMPAFTRHSYKKILDTQNIKWSGIPKSNELTARKSAPWVGFWMAIFWPLFGILYYNAQQLQKSLDVEEQKRIEKVNTERLLKECAPELEWSKAFKKAEEEAEPVKTFDSSDFSRRVHELSKRVKNISPTLNLENVTYNANGSIALIHDESCDFLEVKSWASGETVQKVYMCSCEEYTGDKLLEIIEEEMNY